MARNIKDYSDVEKLNYAKLTKGEQLLWRTEFMEMDGTGTSKAFVLVKQQLFELNKEDIIEKAKIIEAVA